MPKINADDLMRELQDDPELQRHEAEQQARRDAMADEYTNAVADIVDDLAEAGHDVTTPSDLKNSGQPYHDALPILIRHLNRQQNLRVREDIVLALATDEARGAPAARLLELFRTENRSHSDVRFRMADTLCVIADASMADELDVLAGQEEDEAIAMALREAAEKARKRNFGSNLDPGSSRR